MAFTPKTKNSTSYTAKEKEHRKAIGEFTFDEIGDNAFTDTFAGADLGTFAFTDEIPTQYSPLSKNSTSYNAVTKN